LEIVYTLIAYRGFESLSLRQYYFCGRGGIGRRARLRGVWATVWVQVPSTAPKMAMQLKNLLTDKHIKLTVKMAC
jgi:hypothetical protein